MIEARSTQTLESPRFPKFVVREGAPKKIRQPCGQFRASDRMSLARDRAARIPFDHEEKIWRHEDVAEREADRLIELI